MPDKILGIQENNIKDYDKLELFTGWVADVLEQNILVFLAGIAVALAGVLIIQQVWQGCQI